MIGKTLGRYEIMGKLGEGGMASVYWAKDPKLNRQVAVKILPPWCKKDPGHMGRFRREVRLLADLSHPNIVSIYDYGEVEEYVFYAMEFLSGGSLADEIQRRGRLDYRSVLKLAHDLTGALDCIHRLGICHRDLKPHNILRGETGGHKLADFGLGKGEDFDTITRAGELIGTLRYLPPEGLEGEPLDQTADLFQLGLVLYEAVTGARPYRGANAVEILRSYSKDTPTNPSACCPDVPQAFDNFVWNLVQMKRKDRYSDVGAVMADLSRLDKGGNVRRRGTPKAPASIVVPPAVQIGPPPRPKQGLPPRVLAAMGMIVLLLLVLIRPGRTPATPSTPDPPTDVQLRVGEHKAILTWRTARPSKGVVEYGAGASDVLQVAEEATPTTTHSVPVPDLEPGREYTISIRGDAGRAWQRRVKPAELKTELVRVHADDGEGLIEWRTSQLSRTTVLIRRYGNTERFPLADEPALRHLVYFSGVGAGVPYQLSIESTNEVDEKTQLDVMKLVEDDVARLFPVPRVEELAGRNVKLHEFMHQNLAPAAVAMMTAHPWRKALVERLASLSFYMSNPHYDREQRMALYRTIRYFQALEAQFPRVEADLQAGLDMVLPGSWSQTEPSDAAPDFAVPLELDAVETFVADANHIPLAKGGRSYHLNKPVMLKIPPFAFRAAELHLSGRMETGSLAEVDFNGKGALLLRPPATGSDTESRIVHRVPLELLYGERHLLKLALKPLPGHPRGRARTAVFSSGKLALWRTIGTSPSEIKVSSQRPTGRR